METVFGGRVSKDSQENFSPLPELDRFYIFNLTVLQTRRAILALFDIGFIHLFQSAIFIVKLTYSSNFRKNFSLSKFIDVIVIFFLNERKLL